MTVTADDLDSVISCVMSGLLPITDRDWSVPAGTLEWDCWHTAEHIGDCLLSYAWQLAVQPSGRYVRAIATAEKDASPAEVLEFAVTGGRVLASMVRTSRAHVRAYHPAGMADPEGFAGLGCHEALLHGNDIARGFGLSLDPPRDVCRRVLARIFPQASAELTGSDPWIALLWAGGRIELPGRPQRPGWRPHPAPLTGTGPMPRLSLAARRSPLPGDGWRAEIAARPSTPRPRRWPGCAPSCPPPGETWPVLPRRGARRIITGPLPAGGTVSRAARRSVSRVYGRFTRPRRGRRRVSWRTQGRRGGGCCPPWRPACSRRAGCPCPPGLRGPSRRPAGRPS